MKKFIICACSKKKTTVKRGLAMSIYDGELIKKTHRYAKEKGLDFYILSAKYGVIHETTVIDNYDQKLKKPYTGEWPEGNGYYVGGRSLYFKNVPERIKPLLKKKEEDPDFRYGRQLQAINELLDKL